jgi:glycosyltransferase involved in cell wall biosynthesis
VAISQKVNESPLRVLFFLPDLDGGGAQRTIINIANALSRRGIEASLAAVRADGPARAWLNKDVDLVDLGAGRIRHSVLPLRRAIKSIRPDVLFSTILDANIVAALATVGLIRKPKLILRETNSLRARGDVGSFRWRLAGWAYTRADIVIALSSGVERELAEDFNLCRDRLLTVSNPVDVAAARTKAGLLDSVISSWEGYTLVAAGRLHRQKGFDLLIQSIAELKRRDIRIVILGDGPEEAALRRQVAQMNMSDRVEFTGFLDNPYPWLAAADLFVLPSRWEGFGHVIVEAMSVGTPVIAADCPHGPADIIEDGVDGRLTPVEDPVALGTAIEAMLSDPKSLLRFSEKAAIKAEQFDVETIVEQYLALFKHMNIPRERNQH